MPLRESPLPSTSASSGSQSLLAMLCTVAAIAYVQRSGIAVAADEIRGELGLDKIHFGVVLSAWSGGYAVAQIPSGWLADRWGSRRALTLFAVLWSLATGLLAASHGYWSLLGFWTLMGVAQAGIFPCSSRAISRAFAPSQRASASGLLAAAMGIGGALAPALTGLLLVGGVAYLGQSDHHPLVVSLMSLMPSFHWRWVFALYALPGLLWAMLFHLQRPERSVITTAVEDAPPPESESDAWSIIAGSPSMWLLCAQQFLRAAAMIFFSTWFPTFLREHRHATLAEASHLTMLAGIGVVVGAVLGGFVSDRIYRLTGNRRLSRQGIAVAGMSACAVLIVCAEFIPDVTLSVSVIGVAAFSASFGGVSGYVVAMDLGGRRVATVFSIMNTSGNLGATVFPIVVGWSVQRSGTWNLMLFVFAGIFAVDAVCWALLNPNKPLFAEALTPPGSQS